jgi:hypothetical protein
MKGAMDVVGGAMNLTMGAMDVTRGAFNVAGDVEDIIVVGYE